MELTAKQQLDIGLDFVLDRLLPLSPLGREKKRALGPYARADRAALAQELENLGKAVALEDHPALRRFRQGLLQLRDIRGTVTRLGQRDLDDLRSGSQRRSGLQVFYHIQKRPEALQGRPLRFPQRASPRERVYRLRLGRLRVGRRQVYESGEET